MKIPLIFAIAGTLCSVSWAQQPNVDAPPLKDAPQTAPIQQPKMRMFQVPIRNVKASLMAYWLDPKNHTNLLSSPPAISPGATGKNAQKGAFTLPVGVDRIVAVDPQNALLVFGTEEGVQQLANTIRFLDRPLRQVEIEVRFFQIDADSAKTLGLQSNPTQLQAGFVRVGNNINAALETLVAQEKAVVLSAPRVTAINNLKADLSTKTERPTKLQVSGKDIPDGIVLTLASSHSLGVTPTINNDDTVTLLVNSEQQVDLQGVQTTGTIVLERAKLPEIVANLRDGETIVIEEKQLQHLDVPRRSNTKNFVFLTPRIVRRTGD